MCTILRWGEWCKVKMHPLKYTIPNNPFSVDWVSMFIEESKRLNYIFGNEFIAIHHIGSTSVQWLKAKPIIDIMPVVQNISFVDEFNDEMKSIRYEPKGENGLPGRRYFQKGGDNRTHHVHIYEVGSSGIERYLAFRDYLRTHSFSTSFTIKPFKNKEIFSAVSGNFKHAVSPGYAVFGAVSCRKLYSIPDKEKTQCNCIGFKHWYKRESQVTESSSSI